MTEFTPKQNIPFLALNEEELRKQAHASFSLLFGGISPLHKLGQWGGTSLRTPSHQLYQENSDHDASQSPPIGQGGSTSPSSPSQPSQPTQVTQSAPPHWGSTAAPLQKLGQGGSIPPSTSLNLGHAASHLVNGVTHPLQAAQDFSSSFRKMLHSTASTATHPENYNLGDALHGMGSLFPSAPIGQGGSTSLSTSSQPSQPTQATQSAPSPWGGTAAPLQKLGQGGSTPLSTSSQPTQATQSAPSHWGGTAAPLQKLGQGGSTSPSASLNQGNQGNLAHHDVSLYEIMHDAAAAGRKMVTDVWNTASDFSKGGGENVQNTQNSPLSLRTKLSTTASTALPSENYKLGDDFNGGNGGYPPLGTSSSGWGRMRNIVHYISEEELSKLTLLRQGGNIGTNIPPRNWGEQKYGHILDRLSAIDNAQPPFGSDNYRPRKGGYHFPPNGAQHPKPYQQLHRALLLGEMDHPFIGNNLPIILREGDHRLGNRHIEKGHGDDIREDHENASHFVQDIIGNATHLYYNHDKDSFLIVKKKDGVPDNANVHPTIVVRVDTDHPDHFTVITAYKDRWTRIEKHQLIKENTDKSGIVRPIDSSPDYESACHPSQIYQSGSATSSCDTTPPKGGSSYPLANYNSSNAPEVKYHFEGLGSFTESELKQAYQKYKEFDEYLGRYTTKNSSVPPLLK